MRVCVCARIQYLILSHTKTGEVGPAPISRGADGACCLSCLLGVGSQVGGSGFCRGKTLPKPPTTLNGDSGCWALNNALKDESMEA